MPSYRRLLWISLASLIALAFLAPHLSANFFRERIRTALEAALGRRVEIGSASFNVLRGPGFTLRSVVIHDDPAMGLEPLVYANEMQARIRLLSLLSRRLEFSGLRMESPSVNLVKAPGAGWNFQELLGRAAQAPLPQIVMNDGRLNFKLNGVKSVFYIRNADLEVSPPADPAAPIEVRFAGEPSRTDRTAKGFGEFRGRGTWRPGAGDGQLLLDVSLTRSSLGELVALVRGADLGIHGQLSGRISLSGPLSALQLAGDLRLADLHRWDQLPPYAQGGTVKLRGTLDLPSQNLTVDFAPAASADFEGRIQVSSFLSRPVWEAGLKFSALPAPPLLEIARHMGVALPESVRVEGTLAGEVSLAAGGALRGSVTARQTRIGDAQDWRIQFDEAKILLDPRRVVLEPVSAKFGTGEEAAIAVSYSTGAPAELEVRITATQMGTATLLQLEPLLPAIAAPPFARALQKGNWSGRLRFVRGPANPGEWTGAVKLTDAEMAVPGLAVPVSLQQAELEIQHNRLQARRIRGQAGPVEFEAQYQFQPGGTRPHRLDIRAAELSAADLEALLMPTLRRPQGFLARALSLGRTQLPRWLAERRLEGSAAVGSLSLLDETFEQVRLNYYWDGAQVDVPNFQARVRQGLATGFLKIDLRGASPSFLAAGRLEDAQWRNGSLSGDAVVQTSGLGAEAFANLRAEGTFRAESVILDQPPRRTLWGAWSLRWERKQPKLELADVRLSEGQEVFTGQGLTSEDHQLQIEVAHGEARRRISGPLRSLDLAIAEAP